MEPNHSAARLAGPVLVLATILLTAGSCEERPREGAVATGTQEGLPIETLVVGGEEFTVELACTRSSRQRGLMFREELPANSGMLFVFDQPRPRSFYMKNCLIDLDVVFITGDGAIVKAITMRAPRPGEPLKYYSSGLPAKYALELPAGTARRLGLALGQKIELPRRVIQLTAEPDE